MISYKTKIGTAIATFSLLASAYSPIVYADTEIVIDNNGADSNSSVNVDNTQNTSVNQTNSFTIGVNVTSSAKTGKNRANDNNGGNVTIDTGDAISNSTVNISVGGNVANVPCACNTTLDVINITNGGANANATANVTNTKNTTVNQTNGGSAGVNARSRARTGKNRANRNNGGNVNITTGKATDNATVNISTPSNTVNVTP